MKIELMPRNGFKFLTVPPELYTADNQINISMQMSHLSRKIATFIDRETFSVAQRVRPANTSIEYDKALQAFSHYRGMGSIKEVYDFFGINNPSSQLTVYTVGDNNQSGVIRWEEFKQDNIRNVKLAGNKALNPNEKCLLFNKERLKAQIKFAILNDSFVAAILNELDPKISRLDVEPIYDNLKKFSYSLDELFRSIMFLLLDHFEQNEAMKSVLRQNPELFAEIKDEINAWIVEQDFSEEHENILSTLLLGNLLELSESKELQKVMNESRIQHALPASYVNSSLFGAKPGSMNIEKINISFKLEIKCKDKKYATLEIPSDTNKADVESAFNKIFHDYHISYPNDLPILVIDTDDHMALDLLRNSAKTIYPQQFGDINLTFEDIKISLKDITPYSGPSGTTQ